MYFFAMANWISSADNAKEPWNFALTVKKLLLEMYLIKYAYFNRIFEDLLECLHLEHDRLESIKESFQEILQTRNAGNTPFNRTPSNTYDETSTPLTNNMNAALLPQISTKDLAPEPEEQNNDSSDTTSDSDEIQTLTDDSDDETIPNIQRINLLFQGLEDPDYNYNATEDELINS